MRDDRPLDYTQRRFLAIISLHSSVSHISNSLTTLEKLFLHGSDFAGGLNPVIGRLYGLKKLQLSSCGLSCVPDWLGDLEALNYLNQGDNLLIQYPSCVIRMKNLQSLDLSNFLRPRNGNCIKQLPVELAFTSLRELNLKGNPITEPREEVWAQGLDAIKSFMRAVLPGGELICADTVNMLGDTGAGKTSVARSLVKGSPCPTAETDRTRVMQQLTLQLDRDSGHTVTINDFGGHNIYHLVMPIFLPASGLVILVVDMTDPDQEQKVKNWLLTAVAKSREIRVIIAGTRADKIVSATKRLNWEKEMLALASRELESLTEEVLSHISHIITTRERIEMQKRNYGETRQKDMDMQRRLDKLNKVRFFLQNAIKRVVTLSCTVLDEGLAELRRLTVGLLQRPMTMPVRWCRIIYDILQLRPNGLYITMAQVMDIAKTHFTSDDDDNALRTILTYLAKTSQIIWVENHPRLKEFVFYSPQKIVDTCKEILHHDSQSLPALYRSKWDEYERGQLSEPLLRHLLEAVAKRLDLRQEQGAAIALDFDIIVDFMQEFNLISRVSANNEFKRFIIPSKLTSAEPAELHRFKQGLEGCLDRLTIRLSFIGAVIPLSFFETSLAAMLTAAGQFSQPAVYAWKSGLIVIHSGVNFAAKLSGGCISLTAYSNAASPWTVLQPMLKRLHANAVLWHGAPPSCSIVCPICVSQCQSESEAGEIEIDFPTLAGVEQQSEAEPTCLKCWKSIPRNLCCPPASRDIAEHPAKVVSSDLAKRLTEAWAPIVQDLDSSSVECIVDKLISARDGLGLITDDERQLITTERTDKGKARRLLDAVARRGDEAIRLLAATLSSTDCAMPHLASLLKE